MLPDCPTPMRIAATSLMALGLLIGTTSLVRSWMRNYTGTESRCLQFTLRACGWGMRYCCGEIRSPVRASKLRSAPRRLRASLFENWEPIQTSAEYSTAGNQLDEIPLFGFRKSER